MSAAGTRLWLYAGLVALALGACGDEGEARRPAATVARWELFEVTLDAPVDAGNPFDPDEVAVIGEFRSPDGATSQVDGFAARDYRRSLVDGAEELAEEGELRWRIRFTPDVEGEWQWRWRIIGAVRAESTGPWQPLVVTAAAPDAHGFVRRSTRDATQLELDDGTPLFAVGENLAWYDARGTYAYDVWIERLAAQGCNYIRLWMPSWAFGLEWLTRDAQRNVASTTLGNYSARLDRAWQLDYVIELARRRGIYVVLSLQNHGAFSLSANSEWANNPYNAANGGPLDEPRAIFTNGDARRLFERRLRYIVARWGYAPNLLAWELWNEVDLVDQSAIDDVVAWHAAMAAELDRRDPNDHLVTTSTSQFDAIFPSSPYAAVWQLDGIDFVQAHFYSFGGASVDFKEAIPLVATRLGRFGKPVLIAEAGVDIQGAAETLAADPDGDGFHDILWSAVFAGTFGSGMSWWWDNVVDPEDLYPRFAPLARFVADVDFPGEGFTTGSATVISGAEHALSAHVRAGRDTVLVWVTHDAHRWFDPDATLIADAQLQIDGLAAGSWTPTWMHTRTGETTTGPAIQATGDTALELAVPTFARDVALRLTR